MSDNSTFLLFLFLGFAVAWLGIIAYVMYVGARLQGGGAGPGVLATSRGGCAGAGVELGYGLRLAGRRNPPHRD